jgi:hypothetical protein
VITSLSSGNISVPPATRERPRVVTPEAIDTLERNNPALRGIGEIMQDMGLWVVDENSEAEISRCGRTRAHTSANTDEV